MFKHLLKPWKNVSKNLSTHLIKLDRAWHFSNGTGATASKIPKGLSRMMGLIVHFSWDFFPSVLQFLLSIVALSITSLITVVPILIAAMLIIYISYWSSEQTKQWREKSNSLEEEVNSLMVQMIQGLSDILFSANPSHYPKKYNILIHQIDDLEKQTSRFNFLRSDLLKIGIAKFAEIFVIFLLFQQNKTGQISDFVYYGNVTVCVTLFVVINRTTRILELVEKTSESIISTYQLLQAIPPIIDGSIETIPTGNIVFNNVAFSYSSSAGIFENLSVVIESGKKIALIGSSGSGKSTIVNLLCRFWDIQDGSIYIGEYNIADLKLASLRRVIVYVFQTPYMFKQSVKENVLMGASQEHTGDEILKVCKFLKLQNPKSFTIDDLVWLALKKVSLNSLF